MQHRPHDQTHRQRQQPAIQQALYPPPPTQQIKPSHADWLLSFPIRTTPTPTPKTPAAGQPVRRPPPYAPRSALPVAVAQGPTPAGQTIPPAHRISSSPPAKSATGYSRPGPPS